MVETLIPIAIEYLEIGSKALDDIYIKKKDKFILLLSKDRIISNYAYKALERLNNKERNIYIANNYYDELIKKEIPARLTQRMLEISIGYDKIKKDSYELLSDLEKNGRLETSKADETSKIIADKVLHVDPSILLQCLNSKNNSVDEYFISHCTNVSLINGLMGKWLGLSQADIEILTLGGLLHDVGKTKVDPDVLNAPRKLSKEEFEIVKMHSIYSYEMLKEQSNVCDDVSNIARWHHEKINGRGYPDGLIGDEIPLFARITAVSDIYDAMVSKRCYKDAVTPFEVLEMLSESKFSDLDKDLVGVLLEHLPDELIGKKVFLSNGAIGEVKFINKNSLKYPLVDVQGEIIATSEDVYCVLMAV